MENVLMLWTGTNDLALNTTNVVPQVYANKHHRGGLFASSERGGHQAGGGERGASVATRGVD
jgi:hypothetical protein